MKFIKSTVSKRRFAPHIVTCSVLLFLAACEQAPPPAPPDTRAADEAAIRQADIAWSTAAGTNKLEGMVSYYTADAMVLPPNTPMATGTAAIRESLGPLFALPGFSVKWQPVKAEVARSGDIGYTQGTYELTSNDPKGNPVTDKGKYLAIWKKQADGSWKAAADMFNSDLPPQPPMPTPAK